MAVRLQGKDEIDHHKVLPMARDLPVDSQKQKDTDCQLSYQLNKIGISDSET